MGKQIEMDLQEKEYLIQECLVGRMRMREAARRAGVGHSTMQLDQPVPRAGRFGAQ